MIVHPAQGWVKRETRISLPLDYTQGKLEGKQRRVVRKISHTQIVPESAQQRWVPIKTRRWRVAAIAPLPR